MILRQFDYNEYEGENQYWAISGTFFGKINLVVGKNASGKTRLLNCVEGLGKLLTLRRISYLSGSFYTKFINPNLEFEIEIDDAIVRKELLKINSKHYIERTVDGKGKILSEGDNEEKFTQFEIPRDELISTRQDEIQYPYLKQLNEWGMNVRIFRFADRSDKNRIYQVTGSTDTAKITLDLKNTLQTLETYKKGFDEFGLMFKNKIIEDFNKVGYNASDIDIGTPTLPFQISVPNSTMQGIKLKESDLPDFIDHYSMSDGMYRALSLIIYFNYYEFNNLFGCILIDDIGEGLDYERATNLIRILIEKTEKSSIQLIMSTNNQFIMNDVSLDYWQVLSREGNVVKVYNKNNSSKKFEDFRFTGLNNFDLFQSDFLKK